MQRHVQLAMPPVFGTDGYRQREPIWVFPAGKPPKLRFRPGSFIEYHNEGQKRLYVIVYAYRIITFPTEWLYCCEEREALDELEPSNPVQAFMATAGVGTQTPRVVTQIFQDAFQAHDYFLDIPVESDRMVFHNGDLIRGRARIVSSGTVSAPRSIAPSSSK